MPRRLSLDSQHDEEVIVSTTSGSSLSSACSNMDFLSDKSLPQFRLPADAYPSHMNGSSTNNNTTSSSGRHNNPINRRPSMMGNSAQYPSARRRSANVVPPQGNDMDENELNDFLLQLSKRENPNTNNNGDSCNPNSNSTNSYQDGQGELASASALLGTDMYVLPQAYLDLVKGTPKTRVGKFSSCK
ncbi:hypothetical protein ADEAN_000141300 [Angomonas deanei]|uniref:Uncharacterized protein n=1 Tax=Angomonas deanei TaxID=59799 RepID=A0A7G2C2T0_9TRYP|nr:hypothetical protein ADEAN_000141300 [Angomonas deanei]